MRPLEEHAVLRQGLRSLQIIVGALLAGVVIFSLILQFGVRPEPREPADGALPLTWILIGAGACSVVMVLVMRGVLVGALRRRIAAGASSAPGGQTPYAEAGEAGELFQGYMIATIVTAAGMEGAALLSLVAYLLEGQPAALVAAGVFGLLLALQMPTQGRLDDWLETELLRLHGAGERGREP